MADSPIRGVRAQGDRCLLFDLGDRIDAQVGMRCLALAQRIREANLPGVLDIVPSFIAVAVYFEPHTGLGKDPWVFIKEAVESMAATVSDADPVASRHIKIPVCYGGEHGPDLPDVAQRMGLTESAVIDAHAGALSRVFMLGFAPGHPYIGVHDERFALPRRDVPRTAVPAGSVAVANRQSTIYPNVLPGGWHIIGATPLPLFNPTAEQPTLLMPGDEIEFVPISPAKYAQLRASGAPRGGA